MPVIIHAPLASRDLSDIVLHIGRHSRAAARRFSAEVDKKCKRLARFPGLGETCEELGPGLREVPLGNYVLYYRPIEDGIELIRVLHGARDIPTLFNP